MGKNRNTGKKSNRKPGPNFNQTDGQPLEDRALKMGAALFGAELLKAFGVEKKILRIAPTEQVYLNIKEFQEDFNLHLWEVLNMTVLGQMLEQKGIEIGIERGIEQGIAQGISQGITQGITQGIAQGIRALVLACQEFGASREETRTKILSSFSLSQEEAEQYLTEYWPE